MTALARADQIKIIHTLKSRAGVTEDDYRAALQQRYRVASSKALTMAQAENYIDHLREFSKFRAPAKPRVKGALNLTGPFAGKLRALWLVGYDCGVVRDRTDKALVAFLERQTGLSHPAFLQEPADARKAIEALKKWLAREAQIDWTVALGVDAAIAQRLAVIRAQIALGGTLPESEHALCAGAYALRNKRSTEIDPALLPALDALRAELGRAVRAIKGSTP